MVLRLWLSLIFFIAFSSSVQAASLAEVEAIRVGYGSGTIRVVVDVTQKVHFVESYAENPSRMIIDLKNSILSENVPREIKLNSTAAKKIRVAQLSPTTVRIVIDTMAAINPFHLAGGSSGHRIVIDVGNKKFTPVPASQKNDKKIQKRDKSERKKKEKIEREIKIQREREEKLMKQREKTSHKQKEIEEHKQKKPHDELYEITSLSGKTIVIDPGHGGNDSGAIGPTGVLEKNVTLKVSLELRKLLEAEGAEVIMTRDTDRTVSHKGASASDIEELGARCNIANKNHADIFISIHADAFTRAEARGTTAYYYSGSSNGQRLADRIRRNLVDQLNTPSRGTQTCNFYVVKNTDMPSTLIELGFISNPDEEKLLNSKDGVKRAAQGILDGIAEYFG